MQIFSRINKAIILALLTIFFSTGIIQAKDGDNFKVGNITYTVISETEKTCKTSSGSIYSAGNSNVSGVVTIPEQVSYNNTAYTVTEIGNYSFIDCNKITRINFPETLVKIGSHAFDQCTGLTGDLYIPDGVTYIGFAAFWQCTGLNEDIHVPASLTNPIGEEFCNCTSVKSVTIPTGVTKIAYGSFMDCSSIESIFIGETLEILEDNAFNLINKPNEAKIKEITCLSLMPPKVKNFGVTTSFPFDDFTYQNAILYVPASSLELYKNDLDTSNGGGSWGKFYNIQPIVVEDSEEFEYLGVKYQIISREEKTCRTKPGSSSESGNLGISGNLNLVEKAIHPNSSTEYTVIEIGNYSFYKCTELTGDLIIPESVTTIGSYAFHGCSGFDGELIISGKIETIKDYTFYGCSALTGNLTIPESVTSIGNLAFYECSGFKDELKLPDNLKYIGHDAFEGCSGFTGNLIIPESVTSMGSRAFYRCSGFDGNLKILGKIETIGHNTFSGCSALTGNLTIPETVTSIKNWAFYGCSGFKGELKLPENLISIGEMAFSDCKGLSGNLIIPESVTSIGSRAFDGCSGLDGELKILGKIETIENSTFSGCTALTGDLIIPESVISIGNSAFNGCSGFTNVISLIETPPACADITSFDDKLYSSATLIVPDNSIDLYKEAEVWKEFNRIENPTLIYPEGEVKLRFYSAPEKLTFAKEEPVELSIKVENPTTDFNVGGVQLQIDLSDNFTVTDIKEGSELASAGYELKSFRGADNKGPVKLLIYNYNNPIAFSGEIAVLSIVNKKENPASPSISFSEDNTVISNILGEDITGESYLNVTYENPEIEKIEYSKKPERLTLTTESMEGYADKTDLKATEWLYLTAEVYPEDADFEEIEWTISHEDHIDVVNHPEDIDGTKFIAKVRENVKQDNVTVTATVKGTEVSESITVNIADLVPGDANDNGNVNVADVVMSVNYSVGTTENGFCLVNANVIREEEEERGNEIDADDIAKTVGIIFEGMGGKNLLPSKLSASHDQSLIIPGFLSEGENTVIPVSLRGSDNFVALKAELYLPEGLEVRDVTAGRGMGHSIAWNVTEENVLKVMVYSLSNAVINQGEGSLFEIKAAAKDVKGDILLRKSNASDSMANKYTLSLEGGSYLGEASVGSVSEGNVLIIPGEGYAEITGAQGRQVNVHGIDGRLLRSEKVNSDNFWISLQKGIYIISVDEITSKISVK